MKASSLMAKQLSRQFTKGCRNITSGQHVAIVGAGPAGFYAAQQIAKNRPDVNIDIYEKLPVPFGLVRYGVAPDHPEVKNCITSFTKTAELPNVRFIGNTSLGEQISLAELRRCYNSVLLTYGAALDRSLNIPGEDLRNVLPARTIVSCYNGHPDNELSNIDLDTDTVMVVGVGNVALDIARMILTPVDDLRKYDVTESWLEALTRSRVKRVVLVGRRGPLQVSYTIKEFRELLKIGSVRPVFQPDQFLAIKDKVATVERRYKRLMELMVKSALEPDSQSVERWKTATKEWELKLYRSPIEFLPSDSDPGRVGKVVLGINRAIDDSKVELTDEREEIDCGLVLRSIGYKSVQVDPELPFDAGHGIVPNTDGKVESGLFVGGWLATGPRGVILDTMNTAFKVAANLLKDLESRPEKMPGFVGMVSQWKPNCTSWEEWCRIDEHEKRVGEPAGKSREKLITVEEMLKVVGR